MKALFTLLTTCLFFASAYAKYSGGTGEPNDPYQIATAADLIALGETPEDYDKHFLLTADIDLDPNLPGRKVFDKAVIAPDIEPREDPEYLGGVQGMRFTGVFDGDGHTISHLTISGDGYLGLFGVVSTATISNVRLEAVEVNGTGYVGGLIGYSFVGCIAASYSTGSVTGDHDVGGLVGGAFGGSITRSYSAVTVGGTDCVGGLVGANGAEIVASYSSGSVSGTGYEVGGLAGIGSCGYSLSSFKFATSTGNAINCFWDMQTSGQATSGGGTGKTTAEMQTASTFTDAGWDFVGETENGTDDIWWILEGKDYPRLFWELPAADAGSMEP